MNPQITRYATRNHLDAEQIVSYVARTRAAYARIATRGEWVGLADLRPEVGGHRAYQDAALWALAITPGWTVTQETNQKMITEADRAAAVVIGCQPNHVIKSN